MERIRGGGVKMTIEQRISNLESRLDSLQESFIQSQRNNVEVTANADTGKSAMAQVVKITPYTATQTAYYGESEKVFYNVPQGNITVFWDNYAGDYSVQRFDGGVNVSFDTLTVAEATISIMVQ